MPGLRHQTGWGCSTPTYQRFSHFWLISSDISTDCDYQANSNEGCSVHAPRSNSYGRSFNHIGGGWCVLHNPNFFFPSFMVHRYAMERTPTYIKIWFWPRTSNNVPSDISSGLSTISPEEWVIKILFLLSVRL